MGQVCGTIIVAEALPSHKIWVERVSGGAQQSHGDLRGAANGQPANFGRR